MGKTFKDQKHKWVMPFVTFSQVRLPDPHELAMEALAEKDRRLNDIEDAYWAALEAEDRKHMKKVARDQKRVIISCLM